MGKTQQAVPHAKKLWIMEFLKHILTFQDTLISTRNSFHNLGAAPLNTQLAYDLIRLV